MSDPGHERLSRSARSLIEAARSGDEPSQHDRERVRRALAVAIAASAGTVGVGASAAASAKAIAASTASSASAAGGAATGMAGATTAAASGVATTTAVGTGLASAGLLTKVAIAVVAVGVGSGAFVAVERMSAPTRDATESAEVTSDAPTTTLVTHRRGEVQTLVIPRFDIATVQAPAEAVATTPDAIEPTVAEAPVADVALAAASPTPQRRAHALASPTRPGTTDSTPLQLENDVLRDALRHGTTPEQRLTSIDAHHASYPQGQLEFVREQRRVEAVRDLCAEGPDAVARFLAAHPHSSSADDIQRACSPSP